MTAPKRKRRRRGRELLVGLVAIGALLGLVVAPEAALDLVVDRARRCFAAIEAEGPKDCGEQARWLWLPERLPWTRRSALQLDEELRARAAVASYLDAAVGTLDEPAMPSRFGALAPAAEMVAAGSGRLVLDLLGPPLPVPEPAGVALSVGDRRALDERTVAGAPHDVVEGAIAAALLEANPERAWRIARAHQASPAPELRLRAVALGCILDPAGTGTDSLVTLERYWAEERKANIAHDYGAVRVAIEACAARGQALAPPIPETTYAGRWDQRERLMALRLRLLRAAVDCDWRDWGARCVEPDAVENLSYVRLMLTGPKPLDYRLELCAALGEAIGSAREAAQMLAPRPHEPTVRARLPLGLPEWIARRSGAEPFVTAEEWRAAAAHLGALAPADRELGEAAGVMLVRAARGLVLRGLVREALLTAREGLDLSQAEAHERQLVLSSVAWLGGDYATARALLRPDRVPSPRARAAVELQRAALALPDRAAARRALAEAARLAGRAAALGERIGWLRLALGEEDRTLPAPDPAEEPAVVGPIAPHVPASVRRHTLDRTLATWQRWLGAPASERRALRYEAFRHRGDAPVALDAYLLAAGALGAEPARTERWLDALLAVDDGRFSRLELAWARHQAARARGDGPAAARWRERFGALGRRLEDPTAAELWQTLLWP